MKVIGTVDRRKAGLLGQLHQVQQLAWPELFV
jgi:hypothetical protein